MTIKELEKLPFEMAASRLMDEGSNNITTLESLKEFIIYNIQNGNLYLAAHVLDCIRNSDASFWDYDYNMGTLEKATPIEDCLDLQEYCEFDEPDNTYKVMAHIHSLNGQMDEVTVISEKQDGSMTVYIVDYNGVKCTAIFNPFVCEYYADDKYGIIKED